jgi:hypothetical protein
MASTCFRLKRLLLAPFLSRAPNPPADLKVVPRSDGLDVSWCRGASTSEYNRDRFEVELSPRSPQLLEILGDALGTHVQFYSGTDTKCAIDRLQPEQPFEVRVRCVNRAGASRWVALEAETCQNPFACGGRGPNDAYFWDQTPTHVEIRIPVRANIGPRSVDVRVKPRRLEVYFENELQEGISGNLRADVLCQTGDYEWELRDSIPSEPSSSSEKRASGSGSGRELFIALEKDSRKAKDSDFTENEAAVYDPARQWDCFFDENGHAKIDRSKMRWLRDGEWRPPKDASNPEEVGMALPDMKIYSHNAMHQKGRDGELDDWGEEWKKKKK